MPAKLRGRFWRSIVCLTAGVLFLFLSAPLFLYQHSISLLDKMPVKAKAGLPKEKIERLWATQEEFSPEECASITPYWLYRWIMVAVINDVITPVGLGAGHRDVSKMASEIAIRHMRRGHFQGKGMFWWHLTHVFLGIWLQRNWSAGEIASKYAEINAPNAAHVSPPPRAFDLRLFKDAA